MTSPHGYQRRRLYENKLTALMPVFALKVYTRAFFEFFHTSHILRREVPFTDFEGEVAQNVRSAFPKLLVQALYCGYII